jgi:hypothetical protein
MTYMPVKTKVLCAMLLVICGLPGCETVPSQPSIWQLESDCAANHALSDVQACTRQAISATYGDGWHGVPQAVQFVDYIGLTADQVNRGALTEAQGRYNISAFASQQSAGIQAEKAAQNAANAQLGLALMSGASAQPMSAPAAPAFTSGYGTQARACGVVPTPALGCRVGNCVCDAGGQNCHYQMVCN